MVESKITLASCTIYKCLQVGVDKNLSVSCVVHNTLIINIILPLITTLLIFYRYLSVIWLRAFRVKWHITPVCHCCQGASTDVVITRHAQWSGWICCHYAVLMGDIFLWFEWVNYLHGASATASWHHITQMYIYNTYNVASIHKTQPRAIISKFWNPQPKSACYRSDPSICIDTYTHLSWSACSSAHSSTLADLRSSWIMDSLSLLLLSVLLPVALPTLPSCSTLLLLFTSLGMDSRRCRRPSFILSTDTSRHQRLWKLHMLEEPDILKWGGDNRLKKANKTTVDFSLKCPVGFTSNSENC